MQEVFEKIIQKLEDAKSNVPVNRLLDDIIKDKPKELGQLMAYNKAIEIVKQEAEEYNNGWIPCSERLPELLEDITKDEDTFLKSCYLVTDGVFVCQAIFDEHGEFIDTLDYEPLIVTAWRNLPEPYQPNGE